MDTVKIPLKIFTTYEALQEYYGDRNDLELGMYESGYTLVVGHAPNAYSFNPQFFTGENNYVPDYIPASPITHMVTALSDNTAYGYTSGSGLYSEHTYATVKATAYDGYTFTNWSNGVETSAYTLLVENDVELTAYFEAGSQPTEPPTEPPVVVADPVITLATYMTSGLEANNMLCTYITCATEGATTYFTATGWEGEYYNYTEDSQNPEYTIDIEGTTYLVIGEAVETTTVYAYAQLGEATSNTVSMTYETSQIPSGRYLYIKSVGAEDYYEPGTYWAHLPEGLLYDPSPLSVLAGPTETIYVTNIGNENNFTVSLINTGGYTDAGENWYGVIVKENYNIDRANEELTITTYISDEERLSTTQVATSTYSISEYNMYWWNSVNEPDYDCGTPVVPIGNIVWFEDNVTTYMTNTLGAVSIDDYGFGGIKSNTENLTAVIPVAVTNALSDYYDEPSKNLMTELIQRCYPNITQPTYAEGICSYANYIGLMDKNKGINSNNNPNSIADRLNELDYIVYNIDSGDDVRAINIWGDDEKIIILNGATFKFKTPISFYDENSNQTVEDTAVISIVTGQEGQQDYIYFHIKSLGDLFTPQITHTWTSISDYCTSEGYTGPLTIADTDFLEFEIQGTLADDIADCYNTIADEIRNNIEASYISFIDGMTFCLVKVTDEQSEYYEKSYNIIFDENSQWFGYYKEILNSDTHDIPYYDGEGYIRIAAEAYFDELEGEPGE